MDCDGFEERIGEYLDQGLTTGERRDFCRHLLACYTCRQLFDDIRENLALCQIVIADDRGALRSAIQAPLQEEPAQSHARKFTSPVVEHLPPAGPDLHSNVAGAIPSIGDLLSCRTLDLLISDFFDGEIDNGTGFDAAAIDHHLDTCRDCQVLLTGLRQAIITPLPEDGVDLLGNFELSELESRLESRILALTALTVGGSR